MPIFDRKPWPAFRQFEAFVQTLVSRVLGHHKVVLIGAAGDEDRAYLGFASSNMTGHTAIALDTAHGKVDFYIRQELHAEWEKTEGKFRPATRRYWYHLYKSGASDAFMRWEYVDRRLEPSSRYPRNHLHIHDVVIDVQTGVPGINLKEKHLPTGWVTIEEVLRFLISELGVVAACADWNTELQDAEKRFYLEFTSKRYK